MTVVIRNLYRTASRTQNINHKLQCQNKRYPTIQARLQPSQRVLLEVACPENVNIRSEKSTDGAVLCCAGNVSLPQILQSLRTPDLKH